MRVANFIEEARLGGPQVRMVRVAAALHGRVETIIFMPRDQSGPFRALCIKHRLDVREMPITKITTNLGPALRYLLFSPFEVIMLARAFSRERVDLVHVSGGSWQFKGVLAAKIAGKPVVWHMNDTHVPGFIKRIFSVFSVLADGFIFTSERTRDYYKNLIIKEKISGIVPPPVGAEFFSESDRNLSSFNDGPVICTVGNINPIKDFSTFIDAAAIITDHFPHAKFQIVGSVFGNQKKLFLRLKDQCLNLGLSNLEFVEGQTDIKSSLKKCNVYVCSSASESWGMSLWEAMAMGIPVVSTDIGDSSKHIGPGKGGRVVPAGNAGLLADAVIALLNKPSNMETEALAAKKTAASICSIAKISSKTEQMYQLTIKRVKNGMKTI